MAPASAAPSATPSAIITVTRTALLRWLDRIRSRKVTNCGSARTGGRSACTADISTLGTMTAPSLLLERDLGRLALRLVFQLEELHRLEVEHPADHVGREDRQGLVVLADRVVVVLAGEADLVLGAGELLLELHEVLVGLQVGIGLGHGEELAQRPGQGVLGAGLVANPRGVDRLLAGLDHALQ